MTDQQVAQTILSQFGGKRFIAMTGCRDFVAHTGGGLSFRLPRKTNRITHVSVKLDPNDTYYLSFHCWNSRSLELDPRAEYNGVHCDQLASIFTDNTGLLTTL